MPCDPNTILAQANCLQCNMTPGMAAAVEIVLLCAIRDGATVPSDPQDLITQASCILGCIPIGMMPAVKIALLCEIVNL